MRRVGGLTEQIVELDNLYLAFVKASRGKQRKQEVLEFRGSFDENIARLREEILTGHVDVGHYRFFTIHDPKERIICAAPFRERVLHHALMNVCHPYFDNSLISDTYATRPGKGVYAALDKAVVAASHYQFLVKLDFRKYYDSICHDVIFHWLERKFIDKRLLSLFRQIIDSYHSDTGVGLPIGNLTSQYMANAYLSPLDHFAKCQLRIPVYIRYMDDILIASNDKQEMLEWVKMLDSFAREQLLLTLKPPICNRSVQGIVFLGYRVLPYYMRLSGRSKRRYRSKLLDYSRRLSDGQWSVAQYEEHILPLIAFANHADSKWFKQSCLDLMENNG